MGWLLRYVQIAAGYIVLVLFFWQNLRGIQSTLPTIEELDGLVLLLSSGVAMLWTESGRYKS